MLPIFLSKEGAKGIKCLNDAAPFVQIALKSVKKLQKLIERIGLKRYLKSLQFRIFIILCVVVVTCTGIIVSKISSKPNEDTPEEKEE